MLNQNIFKIIIEDFPALSFVISLVITSLRSNLSKNKEQNTTKLHLKS